MRKVPWVTVLRADPTDRAVFQEEKIGQADVFVGLVDDDEANIIACVLAKTLGVTQVIAVVPHTRASSHTSGTSGWRTGSAASSGALVRAAG